MYNLWEWIHADCPAPAQFSSTPLYAYTELESVSPTNNHIPWPVQMHLAYSISRVVITDQGSGTHSMRHFQDAGMNDYIITVEIVTCTHWSWDCCKVLSMNSAYDVSKWHDRAINIIFKSTTFEIWWFACRLYISPEWVKCCHNEENKLFSWKKINNLLPFIW